jgi:hypothetical protein
VNDTLDPRAFTIKTLPERLRKWKRDPVRAVLTEKADLGTALVRLEARLRK